MKILGLDLSIVNTGYSFGTKETTGSIQTKKIGLDNLLRIIHIRDFIRDLVIKEKPDVVVIEDFAFGARGMGLFQIAGLGWVVRTALKDLGTKFELIPPSVLKKFITGKGNADKELMLLKAYKKFGVEFEQNDECDAFCLVKYQESLLEGK
jgi:crossover junction endodeoxyribonuclease RuvC